MKATRCRPGRWAGVIEAGMRGVERILCGSCPRELGVGRWSNELETGNRVVIQKGRRHLNLEAHRMESLPI
jgi:hypothetical protein